MCVQPIVPMRSGLLVAFLKGVDLGPQSLDGLAQFCLLIIGQFYGGSDCL